MMLAARLGELSSVSARFPGRGIKQAPVRPAKRIGPHSLTLDIGRVISPTLDPSLEIQDPSGSHHRDTVHAV
jgi:hypothetical protein